MRYKAIVFDLDNTLMNRKKTLEAFSRQFIDRYFPETTDPERDKIMEMIRIADRDGYVDKKELFQELLEILPWETKPELDELLSYWFGRFPECAEPMSGLYQILDELKKRQVKLGLITNGLISVQNTKIDRLNIRHYFDVIIISDELKIIKPDIRIFQHALQRLEVAPCDAIYVGDHPGNDVDGARNAGMCSVWLEGFMDWIPAVDEAEHKINQLEEILLLL
jgi:putative hydrolase of the HAD superfamily